jgi:hypothetical protein
MHLVLLFSCLSHEKQQSVDISMELIKTEQLLTINMNVDHHVRQFKNSTPIVLTSFRHSGCA